MTWQSMKCFGYKNYSLRINAAVPELINIYVFDGKLITS